MKKPEHPMQPVVFDKQGVARFKENRIVSYMLDTGRDKSLFDLNTIAIMPFDRNDREQLAQLIGYSVSGFGDLSYVRRSLTKAADEEVQFLMAQRKK